MRSLYWKIFISFWLATILIIITTAWVTSQITRKSSIPIREQVFMNSYANAAVATFESGRHEALKKWLVKIGLSRHMKIFLLSSDGDIIGNKDVPAKIYDIQHALMNKKLSDGIFKTGNIIVSHEIVDVNGTGYRLAAQLQHPIGHLVKIPWAGLTIRLTIAIFISGLICYLLSLYLTQPLRTLRLAAKSIAKGNLNTRVGNYIGNRKDEIADLSEEFDEMAARLEALITLKQRLLQDISHELRSPLARLQVALELARKKTNNEAPNEFNRMELETYRLNELIGEILDLARLDKSTMVLKRQQTQIKGLLEAIIVDANFEFGNNRVQLVKSIDIELNLDQKLVHRAFENIIRNALRYTDDDSPVLVSMTESDESVDITIQDEGPGVPEEQLEQIFSPFYRVDRSREKKTGGYGLGLAITKQAIKLHDGNIRAKNNIPKGLILTITLPISENR
jgi:two-component system, OmpR family, sensor histidine kinase CpxA